jgi:hypothetical protein
VNLIRKEGGAKLVPGEIVAPAISVLGNLMKHFRHPPAASPVTPTAGTGMPRDPGAGSRDAA